MLRTRVDRLEKRRARPERPQGWRYFRFEDGMYTPGDVWRSGGQSEPPMTPEEFAAWRAAYPRIGVVIEEVIDWRGGEVRNGE